MTLHPAMRYVLAIIAVLFAGVSQLVPRAQAQQTARHGGTLVFTVGSEPASFDGHREDSFATIHPFAPFYSVLVKVNQDLRDVWLAE